MPAPTSTTTARWSPCAIVNWRPVGGITLPSITAVPLQLDSPVRELPGCGPAIVERLGRLGIRTVRDLLLKLPYEFDDFGEPRPIAELVPGRQAMVVGTLTSIGFRRA